MNPINDYQDKKTSGVVTLSVDKSKAIIAVTSQFDPLTGTKLNDLVQNIDKNYILTQKTQLEKQED